MNQAVAYQNLLAGLDREHWKYTRLKAEDLPLGQVAWHIEDSLTLPGEYEFYIAIVNTRLYHNLPAGVKIKQATQGSGDQEALSWSNLNARYAEHPLIVEIAPHTHLTTPLLVHHHISAERAFLHHPRTLIQVGAHSDLNLIESYAYQQQPHWVNAYLNINLEPGAKVTHSSCQINQGQTMILEHVIQQQANSEYHQHTVHLGDGLHRHQTHIHLCDRQARAHWNGIYLGREEQHYDISTTVNHIAPECSSQMHIRGLCADHATAAFTGCIQVAQDAAQTHASLDNKNILLTPTARINSRPQLEIYHDDVQCRHGATVGHLDEMALFYLRSRGLTAAMAQKMLLAGFLSPLIEALPFPWIQNTVQQELTGITRSL